MFAEPEQEALIRDRAMYYLARREHSAKELRDKLLKKFEQREIIDSVLSYLQEVGLQCDERYTELFVRHKTNTGKGPYVIRQLLMRNGISSELIARHLDTSCDYWLPYGRDVYERKYRGKPIEDYPEKNKRQRFMMSRGFSQDVISAVVNT